MLGQTTPPATQSDKAIAVAAVWRAVFAGAAFAAVDDGLDTDAISGFEFGVDAFADFFNGAAEFVAKGQRDGFACDWVWCRWAD